MKKKLTLEMLEKEVLKINGTKELEESEKIGVILLSAAFKGVDTEKIREFTKYPRRLVRRVIKWLRDSGSYEDGKLNVEWFKKGGGIALLCDTMCVQGLMQKSFKE